MLCGIQKGRLGLYWGFVGRSLLGYDTHRDSGATPPVGSDTLRSRFSPTVVANDIYIKSVWTSSLYNFQIRQDGTYWYPAGGDKSPQSVAVDAFSISLHSLYGEGQLAINGAPPIVPTNGYFNNATLSVGQAFSLTLNATSTVGTLTYTVASGSLPPGLSLSGAVISGTPTTLGVFGFTIRAKDLFGNFTDSAETVNVALILPSFRFLLVANAQAIVTALGLTNGTAVSQPGTDPVNTVESQVPAAGTALFTFATTVTLTYSDGTGFVTAKNVFPQNIQGLTWNGGRTVVWASLVQESITGKTTNSTEMQFPIINWELQYELLNQAAAQDELKAIMGLYNMSQGQAGIFLYADPAFNSTADDQFGLGDGATKSFQLVAHYQNAGGPGIAEIIQSLNGAPTIKDATGGTTYLTSQYSISATGIVTFNSAPTAGHALTWTGNFYYNCRFADDDLSPEEFAVNFWKLQKIKFRSIII